MADRRWFVEAAYEAFVGGDADERGRDALRNRRDVVLRVGCERGKIGFKNEVAVADHQQAVDVDRVLVESSQGFRQHG